jgi:hypothetical protein
MGLASVPYGCKSGKKAYSNMGPSALACSASAVPGVTRNSVDVLL